MHGGLKGGVVLRREGEMKVCGDGVDFFEDGVAVELDSLYDRLVSSGLDRPSRNGEKGRPGSDAWVWDKLEGRCHAAKPVEGRAGMKVGRDGSVAEEGGPYRVDTGTVSKNVESSFRVECVWSGDCPWWGVYHGKPAKEK